MKNLVIYLTGEYEDKEGGRAHWEEAVSGDIQNVESVINQAIEALGRMERHVEAFTVQPLPDDEETVSESEAYRFAH